MTERNYEARRLEDVHQVPSLLTWCHGTWTAGDLQVITPANLDPASARRSARLGDWIIRAADGTVRVEQGGNQDGYCTDCGEPVWWHEDRLVTRSGRKWCFGKDAARPGMTHWHVLPGMAQWVARSPDGQVCRCLDRDGPHIHATVPADPDATPVSRLQEPRDRYRPGGPPAPGHRTLNVILRDAIRASVSGKADRLPGLRAEYDAAAAALFDMLTAVRDPVP
jgi:hypothetical protein